MFLTPMSLHETAGWEIHIYGKAFATHFVLTVPNFTHSNLSKTMQWQMSSRCVLKHSCADVFCTEAHDAHNISAWASELFVLIG